jgi:DNA-binding response OmpR family regulator
MEELLFRVEAVLRRTKKDLNGAPQSEYKIGEYMFYPNTQLLKHGNEEHKLTTKESDLLKLLCANKNMILDRNFALKTIWVDDNYFNARSMDVYIAKLRKFLKEDPRVQIINVHGKGFKLIES